MSTDGKRWAGPPTADDFAAVGQAQLDALPAPFRELVRDVPIRVQDYPDETTLDDLGIADPLDLTGLYHGVPVGLRESRPFATGTDLIFLYRLPILVEWAETGVDLEHLVRHVLIHEIGHHFGLSDEAMAAIEADEV